MKKTISFLVLIAAFLSLGACKKSESTTTTPSLSGLTISSSLPYVREGVAQTFTADISEIYTSDGTDPGTIGIYWQVNSSTLDTTSVDISKSNPSYTVSADTLGTYTVKVHVFAVNGNYYNGAATTSFTALDPDTALEGLEGDRYEQIGGNRYHVTEAGGLTWMAANLYGTESGSHYQGCEVVSSIFGKYYTWEEAQDACPDGWRLPSAAEFDQALGKQAGDAMVDAYFLDDNMWTYWPQVKISNKYLFNAIPSGYLDLSTPQQVYGFKNYAIWWTSDQGEDSDMGIYRYIYVEDADIKQGKGGKNSLALSVRCVKEN